MAHEADSSTNGNGKLAPRRVVTGHTPDGKPVVLFDGPIDTTLSMRAGQQAAVLWSTDRFPSRLTEVEDAAHLPVATSKESGTVFRVIQYEPGVAARIHRTHSLDYAVVLGGEIDMEMEGGTVTLRQGDFLVQQGTIHNWVNRSDKPCVMAFVLVAAEPFPARNGPLPSEG